MAITCSFINLKPGTAKTTSAVFLAAACAKLGMETVLVDADPAGSAQRWADLAGGMPWHVMGMARRTIAKELPSFVARLRPDAVIIDTPQLEDHAVIARGAMSITSTWIVPVAPAGIELDRTRNVIEHMDEVQGLLSFDAERLALLTRTNRRRPSRTEGAPDRKTRDALTKIGLPVFDDQVPLHDDLYRQSYGSVPDPTGGPYEALALYLRDGAGMGSGTPTLRVV